MLYYYNFITSLVIPRTEIKRKRQVLRDHPRMISCLKKEMRVREIKTVCNKGEGWVKKNCDIIRFD